MKVNGVYALIYNQQSGDVLMARRGPKVNNAGMWNLPGGRVDSGEKPRAALRRELREEMGWKVSKKESSKWVRITSANLDDARVYYLILVPTEFPIKLNAENDLVRWLPPNTLRLRPINPPTAHFLYNTNIPEVIHHG